MNLLALLLSVATLTNSRATLTNSLATLTNSLAAGSSGHAVKRAAGEESPLEAAVLKLSADLSQLTAQQSADVNRLEVC